MVKKTNKQVLADFIKKNKVARLKTAINSGFDSVDEFRAHLIKRAEKEVVEFKPGTDFIQKSDEEVKEVKEVTIHNVHILDASYSMGGFKSNSSKLVSALKGINDEVDSLKKDKSAKIIHSFISFASRHDQKFHEFRTDIKLVPKININTRGNTSLYRTLSIVLKKLIDSIPKSSNEKTIVKVFTDGSDNDSGDDITMLDIRVLIEDAKKYDITVTFVGTESDVRRVINTMNIDKSNTLVHDNTAESVTKSFTKSAKATANYVSKSIAGEDVSLGFYKGIN